MPTNNSYPHEPAIGKCTNCGTIVTFEPNQQLGKCPRCGCNEHRSATGAVSPTMQRHGYRVGEGVIPRNPY